MVVHEGVVDEVFEFVGQTEALAAGAVVAADDDHPAKVGAGRHAAGGEALAVGDGHERESFERLGREAWLVMKFEVISHQVRLVLGERDRFTVGERSARRQAAQALQQAHPVFSRGVHGLGSGTPGGLRFSSSGPSVSGAGVTRGSGAGWW